MIQPFHETTILPPDRIICNQVHFLVQGIHEPVKSLRLGFLDQPLTCSISHEPIGKPFFHCALAIQLGQAAALIPDSLCLRYPKSAIFIHAIICNSYFLTNHKPFLPEFQGVCVQYCERKFFVCPL